MATPVLTLKSMRAWEADSWAEGILETEVIARVGQKVGGMIMGSTSPGDSVLMLAGKGHNGDDVRAAVGWISGRNLTLINFWKPASQLAQLEKALACAPTLIVEGLFGIGLNRPLEGAWTRVVEQVNASSSPTISIDIPSGLNADDGVAFGSTIQADQTWTVGAVKSGLIKSGASDFVGQLMVLQDVGLATIKNDPYPLFYGDASDFKSIWSGRSLESHKGTHGCVKIFAGSLGYHGAAVLAARGATKAKPGLIELATHKEVYLQVCSQLQNVMVHPIEDKLHIPSKTTSVVIGPGLASEHLSPELKSQTAALWGSCSFPVIADASALDWLPPTNSPNEVLRVITPHPGEAARLLGCKASEIQADRVKALRDLSEKYGNCFVVLKGHQTLVGTSTGPIFINPSGNPTLAQGGSGDILAGYLGGLFAQRAMMKDPFLTLRYGVWAHGQAADDCTVPGQTWSFDQLLDKL